MAIPRLLTDTIQQAVTKAKQQQQPTSPTSPLSPTGPNINPIPNTATGITQLADGAGGAVPVPPTSLAPPTVAPPSTTAPMTPFTATSNLIGQQINPAGSVRLLGAQGYTDQALGNVFNSPDRFQLAQQQYDTFAQNADNNFGHAVRDATSAAAAHGQIGSGMLTNRYGDLTQQYKLADNTARSNFLTSALEGTIGDRLNNLGAAQGVEQSIYGQDLTGRNELRGERGYQQGLAEQAIARRIQQAQLEAGLQNQSFNQGMDLYQLGLRSDPTQAYQNAAALASAEAGANTQDVGSLLRYFAMNRTPLPAGY